MASNEVYTAAFETDLYTGTVFLKFGLGVGLAYNFCVPWAPTFVQWN